MRHLLRLLFLSLPLLVLTPSADAFQCSRQPAVKVLGLASRAPVNVQIYLRATLSASEWKTVRVVDSETKVKVAIERLDAPLRLRPKEPLTPERRYGVWVGKKRIASFKTTDAPQRHAELTLSATFSRAHTPHPNTPAKEALYEGRSASIVSKALRDAAPSLLVISGRLWAHKDAKDDPLVLERIVAYRGEAEFASTSPCRYTSTPAPNQGRYLLKVTPWWPDGHQGETVTLEGKIR
jgi:hypothetical protein